MAKLTELKHTNTEQVVKLKHSHVSTWIQTMLYNLLWFLSLPWLILTVFLSRTTRSTKSFKEDRKVQHIYIVRQKTATDNTRGDDDDDDNDDNNEDDDGQHKHEHEHYRKNDGAGEVVGVLALFNQSHRQQSVHIDNMLSWTATESLFDDLGRVYQPPCPTTYTPRRDFERIMSSLSWLQDNGEFEIFDQLSSGILQRYIKTDPDIAVSVLIEQSRCMLYRDRISRAKYLAHKAVSLSSGTNHPAMYVARACLVINACYRRKGKLGKAKAFLEMAEQNLTNTCYYEDWCLYYDAYGSYFNSFIDTVSNPSPELLGNATKCFYNQLEAANRDPRRRVQVKYQFYGLLKTARTLLDANTSFGQQRHVAASDVRKAGKYLNKIETELWESVPRGTYIQFLLIKCKQYYREKKYQEGFKVLKQCEELARARGYERDHGLIVNGLQLLENLVEIERQTVSTNDEEVGENEKMETSFSSGKESAVTDTVDILEPELND